MSIIVKPGQVKGEINPPPSKSILQRYIAAGLLSRGKTKIRFFTDLAEDPVSAVRAAKVLGAEIEIGKEEITISGNPKLSGLQNDLIVDCGESGLCARIFAPIAALSWRRIRIEGSGTLSGRPMHELKSALVQAGAECSLDGEFLPAIIKGPLKGGEIEIDGSHGSQLLSGLLLALPLAPHDSLIKVKNLKSRQYIDLTLDVLDQFGIKVDNRNYEEFTIAGRQSYSARDVQVEGDWSAAAFLLCAGAIAGEVSVEGLDMKSNQPDRAIVDILTDAGAEIIFKTDEILVKKSRLKAFDYDASDSPDLFPPLAALAAYCQGTSGIKGVSRLFSKESNRAEAIKNEYGKVGVDIEIIGDKMLIHGRRPTGGSADSRYDHRIAMGLAVLALRAANPIEITNPECVNKSYPDFFEDLEKIK